MQELEILVDQCFETLYSLHCTGMEIFQHTVLTKKKTEVEKYL